MIPNNYEEFLKVKETLAEHKITEEDVDRFHPDKINNVEFWSTLRERFGAMTFCGPYQQQMDDDRVRSINATLHIQTGLVNRLLVPRQTKGRVLDIGAGLCPIKSIIGHFGLELDWDYYAADLINYAPIANFYQCNDGLPDNIPKDFDLVLCGNVLQHLSEAQIRRYIRQAYEVVPQGHFILGGQAVYGYNGNYNSFNGLPYTYNYGQYTRLFTSGQIIDWLKEEKWYVGSVNYRYDGYTVFECYKQ